MALIVRKSFKVSEFKEWSDRVLSANIVGTKKSKLENRCGVRTNNECKEAELKDDFYEQLSRACQTGRKIRTILMGDFNANTGRSHSPGAKGHFGCEPLNDNGVRLTEFAEQHHLSIMNSLFRKPEHEWATWYHPRTKKPRMLDYLPTEKRLQRTVINCTARSETRHMSDHRLLDTLMRGNMMRQKAQKGTKRLRVTDARGFEESMNKLLEKKEITSWDSLKTIVLDGLKVQPRRTTKNSIRQDPFAQTFEKVRSGNTH